MFTFPVCHNFSFIPSYISGLELWLDASDASTITESGGAVSQWDDKSGQGNHATQATGSKQPLTGSSTVNGRNALDFDGSDDVMLCANLTDVFSNVNDFTIFLIIECDTYVRFCNIFNSAKVSSDRFSVVQSDTGGGAIQPLIYTGSYNGINRPTTSTNPQLVTVTCDGSELAADRLTGWLDNNLMASGADASFSGGQIKTAIGRDGAESQAAFNGRIAEVIAYSQELSAVNIDLVERYLSNKWGISI